MISLVLFPRITTNSRLSKNMYSFVDKVKSKNINQKNDKLVLELLAIDYLKNNKDYEINLIFSNNAHIALTTETIEARLEDQNEILDK